MTYPTHVPTATPSYRSRYPQRHPAQPSPSPFPRDGTPTPTIRGKPDISYHYQRTGFVKPPSSPPPFQQMSQSYTWVIEQEYMRRDKQGRMTEKWVLEQQCLRPEASVKHRDRLPGRGMWEELAYSYEMEAERWMRQEEELRRAAVERERSKARYVQEELKRVESRNRQKREAERQKMVEHKLRAQMETRDRERKERLKAQKNIIDAWSKYESGWEALLHSTAPLSFSDIPWPTKTIATHPSDITPSGVVALLLSPFHSAEQSRKDRVRSAQLRWHPDRFRRLMGKVKEEDRGAVEKGVGIVARCLNDIKV